MRGDIARINPERFMQHNAPKTRVEALEIVNRWNNLVAKEAIQAGLSNAEVFYFIGDDQWKEPPRVCNSRLHGYERIGGGIPVPIVCTRLFGHEDKHSDQKDGNPIEWASSGPFSAKKYFEEGVMRVKL